MLLYLQTDAAHLPNGTPINITLQQPPGMPEWAKILISAGVGAFFAILGSIVMEYAKPVIAHRLRRASVRTRRTNHCRVY